MQIELRPHRAIHCASRKEIDTNQDRIHVDGRHVGYVHRRIDSPISLIVTDLDDETKQAIQDQVLQAYGGEQRPMGQPVEIPSDEIDLDDDGIGEDEYDYE